MSASREGGDVSFSTDGGGSEEVIAFPFPFTPVGTPRGGEGPTRHPPQFLSLLEVRKEDGAPRPLQWKLEQPLLVEEWQFSPLLTGVFEWASIAATRTWSLAVDTLAFSARLVGILKTEEG